MAATRAYAPETRPLYGAGTRTSSSREFAGRTSGRATVGYGAPVRSRDYGYADYGYAPRNSAGYGYAPAAPTVRMSSSSSRPASRNYGGYDYWNGSTAPDFAYWDELSSSEAYAWDEAVPAEMPATRTRKGTALPATKTAAKPATKTGTKTGTTKTSTARPARKHAAPAPKPVMESVWETRDEAVTKFNALPTHVVLAVVTAIFIVALAVVSFIRIGWNSDTVLVKMASEELSQTITSTRLAGRLLEVQRGSMVTASRIRVEALYRGMMEPDSTESLVLKPDTIVVDEEGHLSLVGSITRVAEASTPS